ncbi:MAG TPA: hypothetical protein ENJ78_00740, partial [candidate division WWE3 bacterium]|nr:hypothetical protein [candidate division WWE3 bacterium]
MKRLPKKILIFFIYGIILFSSVLLVNNYNSTTFAEGDDLEKIEKDIDKTKDKIEDLSKEIEKIKGDIDNLSGSLSQVLSSVRAIQAKIAELNNQIFKTNSEINDKAALLSTKIVLRNRTLRNFYKNSPNSLYSSLIRSNALINGNAEVSQYLKRYFDESLEVIMSINSDIQINKENKKRLEDIREQVKVEEARLLKIKADTEKKLAEQQAALNKSSQDLSSLNEKLSKLLEKQKQILAEKEGNFSASLAEGLQTDDPKASPSYNPGFSPAFAAFSYGAYTHRNGLSQYGAKGRADDGKSYKEILKFYFPDKDLTDDYDVPSSIHVKGDGIACSGGYKYYDETVDFQTYLKRIYEMYGSWPKEALKAQVIVSRTYAIRIINVHGSIKPNQSHQVYKNCNKGGAWDEAVEETKDKVLVKNGQINFLPEYSSTTGGYINGVGWDVDGDWPKDAYEKKAGSPWFLKGWYTKSYSVSSDKCGREHPWLNEKEMA